MGIYASFQFFGAFLGGMLSGFVTDIWSPEMAYLVGAVSTLLWLYIISGLKEVSRVKRVMMNGNFNAQQQDALEKNISLVPGVLEVTLNSQNGTVYLKVNRDFDATQARAVIDSA